MIKAFVCGRAGGPGHSSVEHTCVLTLSCESREPGWRSLKFYSLFFAIVSHKSLIKLLRSLVYITWWHVTFHVAAVKYVYITIDISFFSFRFGRKKVVFISLAAQCVAVLLQSFSYSWRMFCIMFLFVGASQISIYISAFVLGTGHEPFFINL